MENIGEYFFRCYNSLKGKGLQCMECYEKPEGIILTLNNQYEIMVIQAWVNQQSEYCTRQLFSVENDKNRIEEILYKIVKRLNKNIKESDEPYECYAPIIIDTKLMEQILD